MAATIHESLKAAYEDVEYVGRPNPHSQPDRIAAVATLFGLAPPDPATARVLEVGCGDGANLLPMAARAPDARFVGCDLSSLLMARARAMADGLGLANVELLEGDLREIASALGTFDYIVAHGFYSWVPPDVRDLFLRIAREHLAPNGLVYVSYNVLPGCHVRRIVWDAIRLEIGGSADPRQRLDGARRARRDLPEAWNAAGGAAAELAREYLDDPERTDGSLYHDDLSAVNDPVYFTTFVHHAGSHGLGFLAESETGTMGAGGLPAAMRTLLASADPIAREQYLDFARVRRFRQSILAPAAEVARARLTPGALDRLHAAAVTSVVQARLGGDRRSADDALVGMLADRYPGSASVSEVVTMLAERGTSADDARGQVLRAAFAGAIELRARPIAIVKEVSSRPRAFAVARWQAGRAGIVTDVRHEGVRIDEPEGRAILAAADGTRDRAALASVLGDRPDATALVDHFLARFAFTGLLEA